MRTLFKDESLEESIQYMQYLSEMIEKERYTQDFFFYMEAMTLHLKYLQSKQEVKELLKQPLALNIEVDEHKITKEKE